MNAPLDPISAVLDAMTDRLKAEFGWNDTQRALQEIKPLEFALDREADKVVQIVPPGLYPVMVAARPTSQLYVIDLQWAFYAASKRGTIPARTKGDRAELGSFAIAARTARALEDWRPPVTGASALRLYGIENLTGMTLSKQKLSVCAVTLAGTVTLGAEIGPDALAPFTHYHSDWDIAPRAAPPESLPAELDFSNDTTLPGDLS